MAKDDKKRPLWLAMEEKILDLGSQDVSDSSLEATIQRIAGDLDGEGYNVSCHGGNLMQLRWAVDKMRSAGKSMLGDLNAVIAGFTLDDVADPYAVTTSLLDDIGATWPELRDPARRPEVIKAVEQAKLGLLIAKAKGMDGDLGIRLLIGEGVDGATITSSMEITDEKLAEVKETIKKELAERARVTGLLEKVADKSEEEKIRFLFDNEVTEALIIEMMQVDQGAIDGVKKAMEEELKEKQRLAEEEAERKRKEAEGPSLEDISADDMTFYIDSIREIMEFSDVEQEIRTMCEQSSIPKALVDIAVSDSDKLDELEKNAQG